MSDLTELLSRDPRKYSNQDIDEIIEIMRSKRKQFNLGNLGAGTTKPKTPKEKEINSIADQLDIKL